MLNSSHVMTDRGGARKIESEIPGAQCEAKNKIPVERLFGGGNPHPLGEGYVGLWAAVLRRALLDYRGVNIHPDGCTREQVIQSAHRWFVSSDEGVGSFFWICRMFNIRPVTILELAEIPLD